MRILVIISGQYGQRYVDNLRAHGPRSWTVHLWQAPAFLPRMIDDPADFLPAAFPPADLILAAHELSGVAELIPDIARMAGARAVIAPVDNENWLPRGLARQLRGWLADMGVTCVTPKPFCTLTESDYGVARRERQPYDDPLIAEFARRFGAPRLRLSLDPATRTITAAQVERDATCGCARFVAEGLVGVSADDAAEKAGLLHHHYPCLASMGVDADYGDTLLHISGNAMKDDVAAQVKPFERITYITPGKRSE